VVDRHWIEMGVGRKDLAGRLALAVELGDRADRDPAVHDSRATAANSRSPDDVGVIPLHGLEVSVGDWAHSRWLPRRKYNMASRNRAVSWGALLTTPLQ